MSDSRENNKDDKTHAYYTTSQSGNLEPHHLKKIGSFIIKRVIASGGMGTVFEALQENPKRPVAVKIIKSNLSGENAVCRLEYEAQACGAFR